MDHAPSESSGVLGHRALGGGLRDGGRDRQPTSTDPILDQLAGRLDRELTADRLGASAGAITPGVVTGIASAFGQARGMIREAIHVPRIVEPRANGARPHRGQVMP